MRFYDVKPQGTGFLTAFFFCLSHKNQRSAAYEKRDDKPYRGYANEYVNHACRDISVRTRNKTYEVEPANSDESPVYRADTHENKRDYVYHEHFFHLPQVVCAGN